MSDCRDYNEILQSESLDSSSDWEPSGETLGSQDSWSTESSDDSSLDSFLISSDESQN